MFCFVVTVDYLTLVVAIVWICHGMQKIELLCEDVIYIIFYLWAVAEHLTITFFSWCLPQYPTMVASWYYQPTARATQSIHGEQEKCARSINIPTRKWNISATDERKWKPLLYQEHFWNHVKLTDSKNTPDTKTGFHFPKKILIFSWRTSCSPFSQMWLFASFGKPIHNQLGQYIEAKKQSLNIFNFITKIQGQGKVIGILTM